LDEQIVKRAAEGDTEAFRAIVEHYSNAVYAGAYGIVGDFHIAQDLTQEVFLRSFKALPQLVDWSSIGGWLYTMTKNASCDWMRKHRRQPVPIDAEAAYATSELRTKRHYEEQQAAQEAADTVWEALAGLEEDNRTAIVLQMYGYSLDEIGAFLGVTVKAVDSRLRRTKEKLRHELMGLVSARVGSKQLNAEAFARKVVGTLLFPRMLQFPFPQKSDELMDKVKVRFESEYPSMTLNIRTVPNYHDQIRKMMACQEGPDLIVMNSARAKEYDRLGYLIDLAPYMRKDGIDEGQFVQPFLNLMSSGGKVLGIPMAGATLAVFYNKSWFAAAGLPYPEGEWTWEQFADTADALMAVKGAPKQWRYGASLHYSPNILEPLVMSRGGRFISPDGMRVKGYLDSPQTIAAMQWVADLIHKRKSAAPMIDGGSRRLFWEGRIGMIVDYIDGMHGIGSNMQEPFGAAPMPRFEDGLRVNVAGSGGIGISSQAANPEAAWTFLKKMLIERSELSEQHAHAEIANTHRLFRDMRHHEDPVRNVFYNELPYAVSNARETSVYWNLYFAEQIKDRLLPIVKQKADVAETLIWAADAIESNLEMLSMLRGRV
jgi:multiple sugar transport system substrate-binding protein